MSDRITASTGPQLGTPEPSSPPVRIRQRDLDPISEEELDTRIRAAQASMRVKRKFEYIEAMERGVMPEYNPFDLDEENRMTKPSAEPAKRGRSEVWGKIQLPPLSYNGKKWSDLTAFLFELEGRFKVDSHGLPTDQE